MISAKLTVAVAIALVAAASAPAQKLVKPAPGSPLRKSVIDAVRKAVEKELGQKVIFKIDTMRVFGDWSFVQCEPLTPKGKPIDFRKTRYREEIEQGVFDGPTTYALVRREKGIWKVREHVIGPTDVAWLSWIDPPYSAPKAIFPPPVGQK